MTYSVILSNGSKLVDLADGAVDNTTSLTLFGRNYGGYGGIVANNFVRLLENAASGLPPVAPLTGQLWYDTANNLMKVWTGTVWFALTTGVSSILGSSGAITLSQMIAAGLAPLNSPAFTGTPTAPTPSVGTNSNQIATTAYVLNQVGNVVGGVSSVAGVTGSVTLSQLMTAGLAPLGSPNFSGIPTAPTAAVGTNNNQLATTAYVINEVGALSTGVSSVIGISGNVTLQQLGSAGVALVSGTQFTGISTAPTPAAGTNTNQLATCAYVQSAVAGLTTVTTQSLPTRTKLAGSLNWYVSPAGNDATGDGTQGAPFATMQYAYEKAANFYDGGGLLSTFNITLMAGTHTSGLRLEERMLDFPGGVKVQSITGQGAPGTASYNNTGTIVSVASGNAFSVWNGARLTITGITIGSTGSNNNVQQSGNAITVGNGGYVYIGTQVIFGSCGGYHMLAQTNGAISSNDSYAISGSAQGHMLAAEGSVISLNGFVNTSATITLSNSPVFSQFAYSGTGSYLAIQGYSFNGTAVGSRFNVSLGGSILVNGAGLNYLPGDSAGSGNALVYGGGYYG